MFQSLYENEAKFFLAILKNMLRCFPCKTQVMLHLNQRYDKSELLSKNRFILGNQFTYLPIYQGSHLLA